MSTLLSTNARPTRARDRIRPDTIRGGSLPIIRDGERTERARGKSVKHRRGPRHCNRRRLAQRPCGPHCESGKGAREGRLGSQETDHFESTVPPGCEERSMTPRPIDRFGGKRKESSHAVPSPGRCSLGDCAFALPLSAQTVAAQPAHRLRQRPPRSARRSSSPLRRCPKPSKALPHRSPSSPATRSRDGRRATSLTFCATSPGWWWRGRDRRARSPPSLPAEETPRRPWFSGTASS